MKRREFIALAGTCHFPCGNEAEAHQNTDALEGQQTGRLGYSKKEQWECLASLELKEFCDASYRSKSPPGP